MKKLTELEKKILNRIQKDWQITKNPFAGLSDELGIDESVLISTIQNLKDNKIIKDITAIFNAESLGYESALIAFKVPEDKIENAASIINCNPGVSHNYLRDHNYNIWFTLAVAPEKSLKKEARTIAERTGASDFLIFKNEKLFKIGLILDIGDTDKPDPEKIKLQTGKQADYRPLTEEEKKAVYLLQTELPLSSRPFKDVIEESGIKIKEERLIDLCNIFKKEKIIRRYSAILKHTQAGFSHNAMTAWKVAQKADSETVKIFLSLPSISHLYLRTIHPGKWEHGLFAMIHAKSEKDLNSIIKKLEKKSGINDYLVLHSLKEFKKQRIRYFSDIKINNNSF
ncbi:MAG: Lrp/AsnC family transcriptional regulator [Spirochaetes bacterium]|nr:Lrp/AsnC family transcriptional regulator [Spirochaetota bacterium]